MKKINSAAIIMTTIMLSGLTVMGGYPELPIGLGSAGSFAILAKSGISTVPGSQVTGDMGVSPIDSTAITGFSLILDSTTTFSTSAQVTGKIYASDYKAPTPSIMTTAISDMETAYTDAAGRTLPDYTELGAGNIGGLTLAPGLYKWGTAVLIDTDVTLAGGPGDVWIFQITGNLTMASAKSVILSGGAQAGNIFWQVAGGVGVEIGTTAHIEGIILSQAAITMQTGASMNGRLLAQKAVTLESNAVTEPADTSEAMVLRSADEVSGAYTYTPGQFINFTIKSITAPKQGTNQFYSIWSDTALDITGFTATNDNVVVTYE
ncbi:MAG: ice-binding family protein [Kiritimatiellae bacterium]|jgi:hypothetical protein|nr:ice-binding family protein [Kiritimatiellia bacterium]